MENKDLLNSPSFSIFRKSYAERKAPLVILLGSGLSAPAGIPTWPKLKSSLLSDVDKHIASLGTMAEKLLSAKVNSAKKEPNYWVCFKLIKEILTAPIFERLIEDYLTPPNNTCTPESYIDLMRLGPQGVVTLNLDKFAGEAFHATQADRLVLPVHGKEIAQKYNQLKSAPSYLVYLHGGMHDPSTWVMTQDDLTEITATIGHQQFLRSLFTDNLVLMVGISADDAAISTRLVELKDAGFRPKNLFWLTNRTDNQALNWASDNHVMPINYVAKHNLDHINAIRAFVDNCLSFMPKEDLKPPIAPAREFDVNEAALDPDELAQLPPENIRRYIANALNRIIKNSTGDVYAEYRKFCEHYDRAVHSAFYRGKNDKFREWFGYKLDFPSLGRGNFGEVYSAVSPDGDIVAVKIMHESIFNNNDMLGGFRRGVQSMKLVTNSSISGMVSIKESFELPPTIIMPYIGGQSLQDVLSDSEDMPWAVKLNLVIKIGRIVMEGHALPSTVLHRDIKPTNIMISNYEYRAVVDPEVVVLDFDMSWHKGSKEKDVVFESRDDFGFLAPEQTDPRSRYSARSTRVDSYGYGMTIFYAFGRQTPRPNEALSDYWMSRAVTAAEAGYTGNWRSAPVRLGRLIARATVIDQNLRMDFASMVHGLELIYVSITQPNKLENPELWAEEVLASIVDGKKYEWDDAIGKGQYKSASGVLLETSGNFRTSSVRIEIRYSDRGMNERGALAKYLKNSLNAAVSILRTGGWIVVESHSDGAEAFLRADFQISNFQVESLKPLNAAVSAYKEFLI